MPDTDTDRTEPDSLARSPQAARCGVGQTRAWTRVKYLKQKKFFFVIKSAKFAEDAHLVICAKML